jgi:hypothetical protein
MLDFHTRIFFQQFTLQSRSYLKKILDVKFHYTEEEHEVSEAEGTIIIPVYKEREIDYDAFSEMINKME